MEDNGEAQKQKRMQQTTLSFPVLTVTKKSKITEEEIVDHMIITSSKPTKQLRQTTFNFPSTTNYTNKKRSFSDVDTDDNDTDDESDEHDNNFDESSGDEYNEFPLDGEPHMCPKEKKLCRHKYFSRLINSKHVRCICGKDIKLDKRYSVKNLKM